MNDHHPDRGRILACLDGELGQEATREVQQHLDRCDRCCETAERLRTWSSSFARTARAADVPVPDMNLPDGPAADEDAREGAGEDVVRIGSFRRSSLLRAAIVILTLGIGAFAVTSTPVRAFAGDLIDQIAGLFGGQDARPVAHATTDTSAAPSVAPASAASIQARDGRVHVVIRTRGSDTSSPVVRVRFRQMTTAVVEAPGASFETSPGRLVVNTSNSDTLLVELPESVPNATVEVDGRPLIRIRGGEVTHGMIPDTAHGDLLYRPER